MAWKSSAVAAHSEPPSIFFYRCWSGVCGKGYEDVVLECLRASGASRVRSLVVLREPWCAHHPSLDPGTPCAHLLPSYSLLRSSRVKQRSLI